MCVYVRTFINISTYLSIYLSIYICMYVCMHTATAGQQQGGRTPCMLFFDYFAQHCSP